MSETFDTQQPTARRRDKVFKVLKWLTLIGLVMGLIAAIFIFVYVIRVTKDLPSVETLAEYKPANMSRVHAGDGKLISEFSTEARVFVPVETIPEKLQRAFISAEDKRFYRHNGWDPIGLTRAAISAPLKKLKGQRIGGTSTLTQQVAKNFLVGDDYSIDRKVREIAIARRMEKAFTKDEIIELYLNEIYFGRGAYGVAAASLKHFGKPMDDLSLAEMTYLASVPKGPANYRLDNPTGFKRAKNRQAYILGRMVEDGYISQAEADEAKAAELDWISRLDGEEYLASDYFVEEARKEIYKKYGQDELYTGGLSIRTTLDTDMQLAGREALRRGLEMFDRRHGYRGPLAQWDSLDDWKTKLTEFETPPDIGDWRVAVVLETSKTSAKLGFAPVLAEEGEEVDTSDDRGTLDLSDIKWAKKALAKGAVGNDLTAITDAVKTGDVILVQRKAPAKSEDISRAYNLRQIPEVNGGLIAMNPHTGRVLALVGGYSFEQSQFNRATQAYRQPGSAFKPFVYAAALENGFTPASQVLDAPFVIERQDVECEENDFGTLELRRNDEDRDTTSSNSASRDECERFYKPANYNAGKFYGMSTLRLGLEKSRNAMTVRLANEIGMAPIIKIGKEFGIYDEVKPELAWALGAGETNLLRLASAYSSMINGGKKVTPRILDRVQDGAGRTIFSTAQSCADCQQSQYVGQSPPELPELRPQIIDPVTAYQVTFMMQGVVENGTGFRLKALNRPAGGKTGTTNDSYDAWFMGFSPDLVVGVYVGMDTPSQMGGETGSSAAAPIVTDFMMAALKDEPKVPFRIPEGVTLAPINRETGEPSFIGAPNFILEAFKPGTEPSLGGLSSTIRIGSGTDTIGLFGSGGGNTSGAGDDFDYDNDAAKVVDAPDVEDASVTDKAPTYREGSVYDLFQKSAKREMTAAEISAAIDAALEANEGTQQVLPPRAELVKIYNRMRVQKFANGVDVDDADEETSTNAGEEDAVEDGTPTPDMVQPTPADDTDKEDGAPTPDMVAPTASDNGLETDEAAPIVPTERAEVTTRETLETLPTLPETLPQTPPETPEPDVEDKLDDGLY
ncbi:PBP1A family penicillin-binding protein [Litorimonas sp. RW-G-Af-16]|uniref:penicillin-binding protein 1A n=1 Tax=Litorimonas sp. RW-G-Af-16 TaxID=3241168 RepID=UPI00390CA574